MSKICFITARCYAERGIATASHLSVRKTTGRERGGKGSGGEDPLDLLPLENLLATPLGRGILSYRLW